MPAILMLQSPSDDDQKNDRLDTLAMHVWTFGDVNSTRVQEHETSQTYTSGCSQHYGDPTQK